MKKVVFSLSLLVLSLSLILGISNVPALAQNSAPTITAIEQIDNTAQQLDLVRQTEAQLNDTIRSLRQENVELEKEITDLKKQQSELVSRLQSLKIQIDSARNNPTQRIRIVENEQELIFTLNDLETEKDTTEEQLSAIEGRIVEKETQLSKNTDLISEAQSNLTIQAETRNRVQSDLANRFVSSLSRYSSYLITFVIITFVFWLVLKVNSKNQSLLTRKIIKILAWLGYLFGVFLMMIFALAGNIALLLSALGLFSAGLAIALQDIITSFVAWILIKLQGYYVLKDIVTINTSQGEVSGVITEIGVLRTAMEQIVGGYALDKERPTGKVIYFPNNLVLKDCFINATRNHPILWHDFNIMITFESDFEKAEKILNDILSSEFNETNKYKLPKADNHFKLFLNIADSGPNFTLVFPAKAGTYRPVLASISAQILKQFHKNKIDLAYPTIRAFGVNQNKS